MKNNYWIKQSIIVSLAIIISACNVKKRASQTDCVSIKATELLEKIHQNTLMYSWYSSKLDAKLTTANENNQDFKSSIRIRKDSAIWTSVKVMSIPVATSVISTDSVKALVKQPNKRYLLTEIDYLQKKFNISADYFTLQDLLSGRPIMLNKDKQYVVMCIDNELWLMSHTEKEAEKAMRKPNEADEYIIKYKINKETFLVEKIDATRINDFSRIIVNYDQFETIEEQSIPTKTSAYFYSVKDTVQIDFSSSKIKLNEPFEMPFNITDSYAPIILE